MTPRIDILIPAYNAERTIAEAVGSMQAQTIADIAIHVVDDGSKDGTAAILSGIARADPRVAIHTKPNGGIVEALNHGLEHCTAEFVARHDADDLADPERLEVQLAHLAAHPETVAVGASVRHIDAAGEPTGTFGRIGPADQADAWSIPAREPYLIHPFLTVRRAALQAVGGYRYVHHAEDSDLYWRLREFGRLDNLDALLGSYRIHDESISGASIVNGRIQAVCSQLAAVSAQRRQRGVEDIMFEKASLPRMQAAGTLAAMVEIAAAPLDADERRWLEEAVAAKLLELAGYRPYELEQEDCAFIGRVAKRGVAHLEPDNRADQVRRLTGSAARLASRGRVGDALTMLKPGLYPAFVARWAARVAMPSGLRRTLRGGRAAPVK